MQAVIGTAGHVDHGKSSLINALTGIHPSHLPEELKRAMTIDLGFAHFTSADSDKIGIIDVPGHERFIRNMVSAVWGLDLVLFVVAADEGWAQLSSEHLKIITGLGIKQAILVLTKCDLVDNKRLQDVENEALEYFLTEMNYLPDTIAVSAFTGEGIEALKQMIVKKLKIISVHDDLSPTAHLYVDRIFSVNGIGTTVTGTLRGGSIAVDDYLTLLPGNHRAKVRSLQSYHQSLLCAEPYSRTAIGLKQVNRKLVQRGSCLVSDPNAIEMNNEWIVQLNPQMSQQLKKQSMVEVALGTTYTQAKCYVYADRQLARLQLNTAIPAFWGQRLLIIQHGGSHIIGAGRLIWTKSLNRTQRQQLNMILPDIPFSQQNTTIDKLTLELTLNGFSQAVSDMPMPDDTILLGSLWIKKTAIVTIKQQCNHYLTISTQGITEQELAKRTDYPIVIIKAVVNQQCDEGSWVKIDNSIALSGMKEQCLPSEFKALLSLIEQTKKIGFDASKSNIVGIRKLLRGLTQRDLIVPTENDLFFTREIYEQLIAEIMTNRPLHTIFNVADARDTTGLSRKQLIPLFNRLEKDGWVKRIGNDRQVCRVYEPK